MDATTDLPKVFELFPKLPTEIRLKIWRQALSSQRRIVPLRRGRPLNRPTCKLRDLAVAHMNRPPPILQVNREARYEGLRVNEPHQLCFYVANQERPIAQEDLYFCPSDVLYLCSKSFNGETSLPSRYRVDSMAFAVHSLIFGLQGDQRDRIHCLTIDVPYGSGQHRSQCLSLLVLGLQEFEIKTLFLVLDSGRNFQEGDTFVDPPRSLMKDCLALHLEIQTLFDQKWCDHEYPRPECHIVSLGKETDHGNLKTTEVQSSISRVMADDVVVRLSN